MTQATQVTRGTRAVQAPQAAAEQTAKPTAKHPQQRQVEDNYEAFMKLDDEFFSRHHGLYALMRDRQVVELFDSWEDAHKTAMLLYKDKLFSIQEVDKTPLDLGIYSRAFL